MSVPQILYYDQSSVTVSVSSGSGEDNLLDYQRETTWSNGNTGKDSWIRFDYGASVSMSAIAIDSHNWSGLADIGVSLKCSSTSDFSSDIVTITNGLDLTKSGSYSSWYSFSKTGRRYWRLQFASSVALTAIPSASMVVIGDPVTFEDYYENNYEAGNKAFDTAVVTALDGTVRTSQPFNGHVVNRLSFQVQSDTVRSSWKTFIETVRGRLYPFFWRDPLEQVLLYMTLTKDYSPAIKSRYNQNAISVEMRTKYLS